MYGADLALYTGYSFEDVPRDIYYAPYVKWAAESGVILGVSASSFEPERAVTRQEMAAMMYRFMDHLGLSFTNDNNEFTDDNLIDAWAKESIMQLKGMGIISGRADNKFDPYGVSTRAEVAAVLRRLIEYFLK
ncbi:S-layer homology domain-containing protein [Sedimentibacter hydroxybenzoicus DSM 7310]|uniref:S-layer homology domain-containing protein n=1 Tax=Sedimentibacter hydroxybenzoicus DSM 7310 TaxID=1123245 RepID=A0A974BMQ7_SEDHY|nr:S-layer homology domain-containing protein [Sedimentibacter hydroxybenzoicus]NYB76099.1 S-layer homology domain-containing protein [Sedimentibacter hydroxybenzoicus DSM 7310]